LKALILNTDNSVKRLELDRYFRMSTVELTDVRTHLQFYADRRGIRISSDRLRPHMAESQVLSLLGSGDFHHLTLPILEQILTPFMLVIFDNHQDCSFLIPKYHCGNWMYHAARLPQCKKILHIGATEHYGILRRHLGPARLTKENKLFTLSGPECISPHGLAAFRDLLKEQNSDNLPIYLSIDKDVLKRDESPGNWDNGVMSTVQLSRMIECLSGSYSIIGADITGEMDDHSPWRRTVIKGLLSWIEHPCQSDIPPEECVQAKHRIINLELLDILGIEHVG
jgi:arginase family enzyme